MEKIKRIKKYLEICNKSLELAGKVMSYPDEYRSLVAKIIESQGAVNKQLFSTEYFAMVCYSGDELDMAISQGDAFMDSVNVWIDFVGEVLASISTKTNALDRDFYSLMSYMSVSGEEELLIDMKKNLMGLDERNLSVITNFYNEMHHLWGRLDIPNGVFELLEKRAESIKKNENKFIWLYERLADYRSKNVLYRTLNNWITYSHDEIQKMMEPTFGEYCDLDLVDSLEGEVMVDCGAFNGDTADRFANIYPGIKQIYCYEASTANYENMVTNLCDYENVDIRHKAVGNGHSFMNVTDGGEGARLDAQASDEVEIVPLDDDIKETISLVKMDIEGAEQSALKGMKNHIINDRPKLIICVYHGNDDIVEIPELIDSIRDDYKFYLRKHGPVTLDAPVDIALYAL